MCLTSSFCDIPHPRSHIFVYGVSTTLDFNYMKGEGDNVYSSIHHLSLPGIHSLTS